ncbi:MAG: YihA family ribosome biogenesis GTP-binding protein [Gammaproteobacteria bacterium]|nr:MAG: YihA family ribosome biogenesis GTP-binding protein [Gammaproteobacteria bacterium]
MVNNTYFKTSFTKSANKIEQLPPDCSIEVAFVGRSNSGKSSAINAITNQNSLAKTSKTPGRTQLINLFQIDPNDESRFIVDLPGYGYAKVPQKIKQHWEKELADYLACRESLQGVMLMMDIRHTFSEYDERMLDWCSHSDLAVHILLTKADKFKRGAAMNVKQKVVNRLKKDFPQTSVSLFSSTKKTGIDEAHQVLDRWFMFGN